MIQGTFLPTNRNGTKGGCVQDGAISSYSGYPEKWLTVKQSGHFGYLRESKGAFYASAFGSIRTGWKKPVGFRSTVIIVCFSFEESNIF
jgi:hypothetical protein